MSKRKSVVSVRAHRVYLGTDNVNVLYTRQQLLDHVAAAQLTVDEMLDSDLADVVWFPTSTGEWRENHTFAEGAQL